MNPNRLTARIRFLRRTAEQLRPIMPGVAFTYDRRAENLTKQLASMTNNRPNR